MVETKKVVFFFAFTLLTVPFSVITHQAMAAISQIEQQIAQIQPIE